MPRMTIKNWAESRVPLLSSSAKQMFQVFCFILELFKQVDVAVLNSPRHCCTRQIYSIKNSFSFWKNLVCYTLQTFSEEFSIGRRFPFCSRQVLERMTCSCNAEELTVDKFDKFCCESHPLLNSPLFLFSKHRHGFCTFLVFRTVMPRNIFIVYILFCITVLKPSIQPIRNKQLRYYCINIRLFVHFATCFDPAGSSSG
jgi:hypothetical protein